MKHNYAFTDKGKLVYVDDAFKNVMGMKFYYDQNLTCEMTLKDGNINAKHFAFKVGATLTHNGNIFSPTNINESPAHFNFKMKIVLSKEIELMKCQQSLWEFFFAYKFFYITHNGYRIDCILDVPDDKALTMTREIQGIKTKNDTDKFIEFSFDIHSYFPIEPIETPPIIATECNRVIFKGNTLSFK